MGQKLRSPVALISYQLSSFTSLDLSCLTYKIRIMILEKFIVKNEWDNSHEVLDSQYDFLLYITMNNCLWHDTTCRNQNTKFLLSFIIRDALVAWDEGEETNREGHEELFRWWKYSLSWEACGYRGVCLCQTSSDGTLTIWGYHSMEIIPLLKNEKKVGKGTWL